MRSTLQALLNAVPQAPIITAAWTVGFNAINNCYTYSYTQGNTGPLYFTFTFTANRCSELMGFGLMVGITGNISFATSLVGPSPAKLNK